MLISGDLVSIPQGSYVKTVDKKIGISMPRQIKTKKYGVVVSNGVGDNYKVLITDVIYEVDKKFLQLVVE